MTFYSSLLCYSISCWCCVTEWLYESVHQENNHTRFMLL